MNKKESYEAPEWGMRVLMVERTPICTSPGEYTEGGGGSYGDGETNDNGGY